MMRLCGWLSAFAFCLAGLALGSGSASALDYPTRPVRWIVGYPPGGATDIMARLIHCVRDRTTVAKTQA